MMQLSFDQIRHITVGSVKTVQTESGISFSKCTDRQIAAFYRLRESLGKNAEATTGVRLDFETDSKQMELELSRGARVEICLNGVLRYWFDCNALRKEKKTISVPLDSVFGEPRAVTRVTIYLPSHGEGGVLRFLRLDDGAMVRRPKYRCRLLFIGDSITQGWNSGWDCMSFANSISRFLDAESVVQGVGGAFYAETTFDEELPFVPDVVLIAYGTNDFYFFSSLEELREHCAAYLKCVRSVYAEKGIPVFVLLPIWRADRFGDSAVGNFVAVRQLYAEEARKRGLHVIDTADFVPPMSDFFADQVLHPNAVGFGWYTQGILKELLPHLEQHS